MFKKKVQDNNIYLNERFNELVRICYLNVSVYKDLALFQDIKKKEKLLESIGEEYKKFLERYKEFPRKELSDLIDININELPHENDQIAGLMLKKKLVRINKEFKIKILSKSRDSINGFWFDSFKESAVSLLKWIPPTILTVGFIKALILAYVLDYNLSFLFSLQDYWDYGVSQIVIFLILLVLIPLQVFNFIALSEYSNYRYLEREKIRYDFDDEEEKKKRNYFLLFLVGIIVCFILAKYFLSYLSYIEDGFILLLIFFSISLFNWIVKNTSHIMFAFSLMCIISLSIYNLWIIPHLANNIHSSLVYEAKIIHEIDLPKDVYYIDSSSKYHIFSTGENTFLVPIGNEIFITKPLNSGHVSK